MPEKDTYRRFEIHSSIDCPGSSYSILDRSVPSVGSSRTILDTHTVLHISFWTVLCRPGPPWTVLGCLQGHPGAELSSTIEDRLSRVGRELNYTRPSWTVSAVSRVSRELNYPRPSWTVSAVSRVIRELNYPRPSRTVSAVSRPAGSSRERPSQTSEVPRIPRSLVEIRGSTDEAGSLTAQLYAATGA